MERAALLTPVMESASNRVGGAVLITTGLYQLSPLKNICLAYCRTPTSFLSLLRPGALVAWGLA